MTYPSWIEVPAGHRVAGSLVPPSSKSLSQRYLNLALVGRLEMELARPLLSDDIEHYLAALPACGLAVTRGEDLVRLEPAYDSQGGTVECGAGGTMLRFLTAALTTLPGRWRLDGSPRLRQRPVGPLVEALRLLGAELHYLGESGCAPLEIVGGSLEGGSTRLDAGASSQYLSALLMAALAARREVEIEVTALTSSPYVDLTLDVIEELGGSVEKLPQGGYRVRPTRLRGGAFRVEGDYSAAAYPAAAAALAGGCVRLSGLRRNSSQGDRGFLDLLRQMGAKVRWQDGVVEIERGELRAIEADLAEMPDQVPTLAALAPFAEGTTRITGVPHLRLKESDRLAAMASELQRLGATVRELDDGLVIEGCWASGEPADSVIEVQTWDDHRIAMSLALVALRRPGIRVCEPQVVDKSYPDFWLDFGKLIGTNLL